MTRVHSVLLLIVSTLLVASCISVAPVPKETSSGLYYPTVVGSRRVMVIRTGTYSREEAETVTHVEEKDGIYRVTVDCEMDGDRLTPGYVYEVSNRELYQMSTENPVHGNGTLLLKLIDDTTWTLGDDAEEPLATLKLMQEEDVEVPAGKFRAIRVDGVRHQGLEAPFNFSFWYAPGVGLVKGEAKRESSTSTTELKSFTLGKGETKDQKPKSDK